MRPADNATTLRAHVEHFQHRVIQDALREATAAYWLRRAAAFEAAKPRPGDYFGNQSLEDARAQWRRLDQVARACRARAEVALFEDLTPEIQTVLREVA